MCPAHWPSRAAGCPLCETGFWPRGALISLIQWGPPKFLGAALCMHSSVHCVWAVRPCPLGAWGGAQQEGFWILAPLVDLLMAPGFVPLYDTEYWTRWAIGLIQHGFSRVLMNISRPGFGGQKSGPLRTASLKAQNPIITNCCKAQSLVSSSGSLCVRLLWFHFAVQDRL